MSTGDTTASGTRVRIFISHSSRDVGLVNALVELLLAALPVRKSDIRCTSLNGCRLPGGTDPAEALVEDIRCSAVFVGLLTKDSVEAPYVLFELGARWGSRGRIFPVLGPGADYGLMPGPIRPLNAFKTSDRGHMHQMIREIAAALTERPDYPDAYHAKLEALVARGERRRRSSARPPPARPHPPSSPGAPVVRNTRTVAHVLAQKSALRGSVVRVRGTVVKFNANIFGRNWIHLRDTAGAGHDNDVTVTTADEVVVGDVVLAEGILNVNKDFGSGYAYPAIVEDAVITK